ncbi:AAA family ATPase [Larkinella insperata]|uniref:AAA family ATPase n=1 Tax=Larkinella insperata TaxID=332158 RepID=A0ABW3QGG7_9BACT|nr:AAA family ATPase [Larkinella insperata]
MLKRVSIQNFKSLKDVTLDLQKVNLLIGPNNSGKTNFLKALEFFKITGVQSQKIMDLESVSYKHQRVKIKYEFDFVQSPNGYMTRKFGKKDRENYHYIQTAEIKDSDSYLFVEWKDDYWFTNELGETTSFQAYERDRGEFFDYISTKIFRPDPSKLTQTVEFSADETTLSSDCSNLISFYFYINSNYPKIAKDIRYDLSKCIPEISNFTTPPVKIGNESLLGLRFFDKEENGYWADEVSEGVLYFLSLLCIIHQPNPPKLLLLEEPERGIHPRRIHEVMNFIFRLVDEKDIQIILTSHNENVLNEFSSLPESVFVFDKNEEGATYVRNLKKIIDDSHERSQKEGLEEIDFTDDLGKNWMYGLLGGVPTEEL